jgi:hypothetical protein
LGRACTPGVCAKTIHSWAAWRLRLSCDPWTHPCHAVTDPLQTRYRPLQTVTDRYSPLHMPLQTRYKPLQTRYRPLQTVTDRYSRYGPSQPTLRLSCDPWTHPSMPLRTRYRPVTDPLQAVTDRYRPLQPVTAAVTDPLQTVTDPLQAVTDRYRPLQPLHTIAANSMSMFMPDETACLHADAGNEPSAGSTASARDPCRAHVRLTSAGCMQSLADMAIAWRVRVRNCPEDETQPLCVTFAIGARACN